MVPLTFLFRLFAYFLPWPLSFSRPQIPHHLRQERERRSELVDRHIDTFWKRSAEDYSRPCSLSPLLHLQTGSVDMWRQFSFHYPSIWRRQGGTWTGRSWTDELGADPTFTLRTARMMGYSLTCCGREQELQLHFLKRSVIPVILELCILLLLVHLS